MEAAGKSRVAPWERLISLAIIVLAAALAFYALRETDAHPTTSDASIDADVVHVAALVGGVFLK
jgi:membrane fusion protein, multidrug efflux system